MPARVMRTRNDLKLLDTSYGWPSDTKAVNYGRNGLKTNTYRSLRGEHGCARHPEPSKPHSGPISLSSSLSFTCAHPLPRGAHPKELRKGMDTLLVDSLHPEVSAASGSPKNSCPIWRSPPSPPPLASAAAARIA